MATITKIVGKNGISYRIRAVKGKTKSGNSKQVSMTWKAPSNLTEKQIEKEVQKVANQFENSIQNHKYTNNNVLFKDYSCEWLYKKKHLSPSTYNDYLRTVNRLNDEFGYCKVSEITALMVMKYYEKLRKPGANKNTGNSLSEKSILNIHDCLNNIFDYAIDDEIIYKNPLKSKNFPRPKPDKKEMKFLTDDDLLSLSQEFQNIDLMKRCCIMIALSTGMRIGEINALEWDDIDFVNKKIRVNKTLQYISTIGIIEKEPKTKKSKRIIDVEQDLLNLLCEYRKEQEKNKKLLDYYWHKEITLKNEKGNDFTKKNNKIFTQWDGKPIFPQTFGQWLKKFQKKHNLSNYTPHSFRHTFATISVEENQSINALSELLEHAKKSTTLDMYVHSNDVAKERLATSVSNKINTIFYDKNS